MYHIKSNVSCEISIRAVLEKGITSILNASAFRSDPVKSIMYVLTKLPESPFKRLNEHFEGVPA